MNRFAQITFKQQISLRQLKFIYITTIFWVKKTAHPFALHICVTVIITRNEDLPEKLVVWDTPCFSSAATFSVTRIVPSCKPTFASRLVNN